MPKPKFTKENQPSGDAKREGWKRRKEELAKLQVLSVQDIVKECFYKEIQTKSGETVPFVDLLVAKLMKEALGQGMPSHKAIEILLKMYQGNFDTIGQVVALNTTNTNLQAAIDAISKDITPPPTE